MPSHGKNRSSQPKPQENANNQSGPSSSTATTTTPTPLTRAALGDLALERQKKREARIAEKKAQSEVLKNTGNKLFQSGDYEEAIDTYEEAIYKYGTTAVLYSNLAAAHLKLEWYAEAERVATEALLLDPKMLKARYRRGLARKGARDYTGALEDFNAVLRQDSSLTEVHMHLTEAEYLLEKFGDEDYPSSDAEEPGWPYYEDDPISLSDSESDSSDCNHTGNNIPCRFYNHGGCSRKDTCNYSHAPDDKSERDKLGRNVCLFHLLGSCKFGDAKCVYSHDASFLPHGWWDHPEYVALINLRLGYEKDQGKDAFADIIKSHNKGHTPRKSDVSSNTPASTGQAISTAQSIVNGPGFTIILALSGDIVEDYKLPTLAALHADGPTKKVLNVNDALTQLATPGLKAVFVADASLAKNSNAKVLSKLVEFARGGGSVVMGGSFSSFITPPQFANFFSKAWGLNWKTGSYHRATFKLNQSHDLAKSSFALPDSYSMKALHVQGIPSSAIFYKEDGSSESPAVQVAFGKGRVGYIGDVNWESSSITVLRAMLSVSANSDADEDTEQKSEEKFVLFLSLEDELDDSYKQPTVNLIKSKFTTRVATTKAEALRSLSSDQLRAAFVVDAGIMHRKNAPVLAKLVGFVKAGGSVVIGGAFSTFAKLGELGPFFVKSWGVPWKPGSYHRTTFSINSSHDLAKANPQLPQSYSMKALHLKDISPDVVVYKPTQNSRLESLVFAPDPITNMNESPAVRTRVGKGYLNYIGDVNWEDGSAKLALAMMGLLTPQPQPAPHAGPSATTSDVKSKPASSSKPNDAATSSKVPKQSSTPATVPVQSTSTTTTSKLSTGAPTPTPSAATALSKESFILLLSLDEDEHVALSHAHCLSALRERVIISQVLTVNDALKKLSDTNIVGVFITDAGIVKPEHKELLPQLLEYVKRGGTVIAGGSFASFVSASDMEAFFTNPWGLSWKSGAYHRTEFLRNAQHSIVVNNSSLASSYSMKALHLRGLAPSDPVYLPKDNLPSSLPFEDHMESPAVRRKIGEGYFGYVGDVNMETETTSLVLAMFGLLDGLKTVEEPSQHAKQATGKPSEGKTPVVTPLSKDMTKPLPAAAGESQTGFRTLPVGPTRRPFLMILSFGGEKFFAGAQADLLELLKSKLEVLHGLSNERVLELLRSQDLTGVLVTDAAIIDEENAYLLSQLVEYAKAGGTVVMGSAFSSHIRFDELSAFFKDTWGVSWESGNYTRCELVLNTAHHLAKTPGLPKDFTMKGLFVSGVASQSALYVPATDSHIPFHESSQAPVAMEQVGKGRVGYIGDVGLQDEHTKIVMAMFGLLSDSSS